MTSTGRQFVKVFTDDVHVTLSSLANTERRRRRKHPEIFLTKVIIVTSLPGKDY